MSNVFHNNSSDLDLGERLANIKNKIIIDDKVLMCGIDNTITPLSISNFGKNLINVANLNSLISIISQGDSNASVVDTGLGTFEINIDDQLVASADVNNFIIRYNKTLKVSNIQNSIGGAILFMSDIDSRNVIPTGDNQFNLGSAGQRYKNAYVINNHSNILYVDEIYEKTTGNKIILKNDITTQSIIPETDNILALGSITKRFNLFSNIILANSVNPTIGNIFGSLGGITQRWGNIYNINIDATGIASLSSVVSSNISPTATAGSVLGSDATPYETGYINSVYTNNVLSRGYDLNLYHTGTDYDTYIKMNSVAGLLNETNINAYSNASYHNLNIRTANAGYLTLGSRNDTAGVITTQLYARYGSFSNDFYANPAGANIFHSNIAPGINSPESTTNGYDCGTDALRWRDIYSNNAPTNHSDRKLKKDIIPIQFDVLNVLNKLKAVQYKWKKNESNRNHLGFIAQDIENTELKNYGFFTKSPPQEYKYTDKNGDEKTIQMPESYSLRSSELISVLVQGIQELDSKIIKLENKEVVSGDVFVQQAPSAPVQQSSITAHQSSVSSAKLNEIETTLNHICSRVITLETNNEANESESDFSILEQLQGKVHQLEGENIKLKTKLTKLTSVVNKILKQLK